MSRDWTRYVRVPDRPVEAMHAHFERHVYHRHAHQTYSLGVTEDGTQAFACRGALRTSAAGMVMTFNPDDPHDGHAADEGGFTYRMVHIGPELVGEVLADATGRRPALPLFAEPVTADPLLARAVRSLHAGLAGGTTALRRDELLASAVLAAVSRASTAAPGDLERVITPDAAGTAGRARRLLDACYRENVSSGDLARAAGRSRHVVYRAFRMTYGLSPGDYQRLLRVREAQRLLRRGVTIAEAAAEAGFADQSHLHRWFVRCVGITPAVYRRAVTSQGPG